MSESLTRQRVYKLREMHKIMSNISNEDYYYSWIVNGVPDQPTEDDYSFIAGDDDTYRDVCAKFARLFTLAVSENEVKILY